MTEKYHLKPELAQALEELEKIIGKPIPQVEEIERNTFGVKVEGDKVIGLCLYNQGLSTLPESIGNLSSLKELFLGSNKFTTLPESIGNLSSLKVLYLRWNKLTTLLESIGALKSLQILNLEYNQLTTLPKSIGNLKSLKKLVLHNNKLTTLPKSIGSLSSLKELSLLENQLTTLSESIGNLTSLQTLDLGSNEFTTLPESIGNLSLLKELDLSYNKLSTLPESIGNLKSLKKLKLNDNELSTLPESIGNLSSLEKLYLNDNQLTTLPESIGNLSSLKTLYLQGNELMTLPESIGNLSSLKELWLEKNKLTALPESLWKCKNLKYLFLGNWGNTSWEGEWKGIEKYGIVAILELCRQKAPITVFVSHSKKDEARSLISTLKEHLKNRKEIREVHSIGENKISESQLLIFIATKNSITNEQCARELGFALTHDISVIPIKSSDLSWNELERIDLRKEGHGYYDLSDEKGVEFNSKGETFEKSCNELYEYIKQYKRDFNLFEPEERKLDQQKLNFKIVVEKLIKSEEIRRISKENIVQLKEILADLKSEQISPEEYIFRTGQIFKSNSWE